MRIYGGHDYYDCGLSLGIDPRIVLVRGKSRSIDVELAGGSLLIRYLETLPVTIGESIESVAVVFCDKVYRGAMAGTEGIWSAEKARAWLKRRQEKERINIKLRIGRTWRGNEMTLEEYFTPYPATGKLREYMIASKVSVLVERMPQYHEDRTFQVNPFELRRLGFAKAIDPYTAFQELSMWIGGVLGGTSPEIVTIKDDKVLIEGHGFDNRISFRGPRI